MREIEFRGWDKEWDKWVYGYYEKLPVGMGEPREFIHVWMDWGLSSAREIEAGSVGQFSTQLAHGGEKIFSGDIIQTLKYPEGTTRAVKLTELRDSSTDTLLYKGWNVVLPSSDWVIIGNEYERRLSSR